MAIITRVPNYKITYPFVHAISSSCPCLFHVCLRTFVSQDVRGDHAEAWQSMNPASAEDRCADKQKSPLERLMGVSGKHHSSRSSCHEGVLVRTIEAGFPTLGLFSSPTPLQR